MYIMGFFKILFVIGLVHTFAVNIYAEDEYNFSDKDNSKAPLHINGGSRLRMISGLNYNGKKPVQQHYVNNEILPSQNLHYIIQGVDENDEQSFANVHQAFKTEDLRIQQKQNRKHKPHRTTRRHRHTTASPRRTTSEPYTTHTPRRTTWEPYTTDTPRRTTSEPYTTHTPRRTTWEPYTTHTPRRTTWEPYTTDTPRRTTWEPYTTDTPRRTTWVPYTTDTPRRTIL